jgi:hypothetical protein
MAARYDRANAPKTLHTLIAGGRRENNFSLTVFLGGGDRLSQSRHPAGRYKRTTRAAQGLVPHLPGHEAVLNYLGAPALFQSMMLTRFQWFFLS